MREDIFLFKSFIYFDKTLINLFYFQTTAFISQVRVAGLVTTLVNVTGGHQGATNALATEDSVVDTRNGTTPKVSHYINNFPCIKRLCMY